LIGALLVEESLGGVGVFTFVKGWVAKGSKDLRAVELDMMDFRRIWSFALLHL
jgi:hypothetical protein